MHNCFLFYFITLFIYFCFRKVKGPVSVWRRDTAKACRFLSLNVNGQWLVDWCCFCLNYCCSEITHFICFCHSSFLLVVTKILFVTCILLKIKLTLLFFFLFHFCSWTQDLGLEAEKATNGPWFIFFLTLIKALGYISISSTTKLPLWVFEQQIVSFFLFQL